MKIAGFTHIIFLIAIFNTNLCGQKLLQLEIPHQVEAVKFMEGDLITFKSKDRPGEWQKRVIETIITGDDLIVFEDGMVPLKDITHFRIYNGTAKAFGQLLTGFGGGWFLFGGIAQLAGKYSFTWGTFAIGAVAIGVGWILNKFVSRRTFKINKNGNLRIIDISFPAKNPDVRGLNKNIP
ncbi:MAG: hypothetical protein IPL55_01825 [Saprospiraceae bacterium]|jgi:hypothetical protein|nr:hypothetical protein [Saprospiraceae bacterium]